MNANLRYKPAGAISAHELVIDFLSNRAPREMEARTIVGAGVALGFSAQSIRMALARAAAAGLVESAGRGNYRLATRTDAMRREVRKWRGVLESTRAWSGGWVAVLDASIARSDRAIFALHQRAIRLRGFRALDAGIWIRPDNLKISIAELSAELCALGLHRSAIVATLDDLDAATSGRASHLWNVAALARRYVDKTREIARSEMHLDKMSVADAAGETLVLGREVLRLINLDPLLPRELMSAAPLTKLVRAMIKYDDIGRAIWRRFMANF